MKQPELGQKLSEIRKRKGISQQELADQCNLNIRTVQRIESGDVNPRPYTVRMYLKCLGYEFEKVMDETLEDKKRKDMKKGFLTEKKSYDKLKYAWVFGIIHFLVGFPESYYGSIAVEQPLEGSEIAVFILVKFASVIAYALFFMGFIELASRKKLNLLKIICQLMIITYAAFGAFQIIALLSENTIGGVLVGESLSFGVLSMIFGIALLRSEQHFGHKGVLAGMLEILAGISFLTVVLGFIGLFILIPAKILEVVILYLVAHKFKNQQLLSNAGN